MNRSDAIILVTLGALWGASFLAVRVAVPEFGAFALIGLRVLLAAFVLLPLVLVRRELPDVIAHWRDIALIGVLHYAIPFCLYAYAMLTLSAGYSGLVNAASPLFAGIVARLWLGERFDASRMAGLALGLAGVVLLVCDKLAYAGHQDAIAVSATLLAAFCYGLAAIMAKRRLAGVSPTAVAGGSMSAAAIVMLPLSVWLWPDSPPSANAWGMVALLGIVCTAVAFVLYFRLMASVGPTKSITVTFLIPLFAVAFGALFIGERVTVSMIMGGAIIIVGTALATGLVGLGSLLQKTGAFASRTVVVLLIVAALDDTPPDVHAADIDPQVDGTIFAGMLVGHRGRLWDATAYLFESQFPDVASYTTFKMRLRRLLRDDSRVGIEYIADIDTLESDGLKFGYYRSINSALSLKILAGAVLDDDPKPTVQIEAAWQLR